MLTVINSVSNNEHQIVYKRMKNERGNTMCKKKRYIRAHVHVPNNKLEEPEYKISM